MKVKSLLKIVLGSLILASCAPEMEEIPAEELYLRDFIKKYGIIDPNQNWSLASNEVMSVRGAGGAEAKIYVEIKGKRYIVADYKNIADPAALTFDIPSGMKDVIVKVNGKEYPTKVGSTVDASAARSRAIAEGTKTVDGVTLTYGYTEGEKIIFSKSIDNFLKYIPEEVNNSGNVISNFSFVSKKDKEVIFYPLFWNTSSSHVVGVYWCDENGDFNWFDESKEYAPGKPEPEGGFYSLNGWESSKWNKPAIDYSHMQDLYWVRTGELKYCGDKHDNISDYESSTFDVLAKSNSSYTPNDGGAFKTKGIKFKFNKDGIKYGFYIKVKNGIDPLGGQEDGNSTVFDHILFSQSKRNELFGKFGIYKVSDNDNYIVSAKNMTEEMAEKVSFESNWRLDGDKSYNKYVWSHPWKDVSEGDEYVSASYLTLPSSETHDGKVRSFFAFEDWRENKPDLNDVVFMFEEEQDVDIIDEDDPNPPTPPTPDEPLPWTLAVEDLGESDDYDFNDLVLEITHVAGTNEATVKALAAGGIMPIYVKYGEELIAETHVNQWLGSKDHTVMINTGAGATGTHSTPITIKVGENEKIDDIIAKFTIVVKTGEGDEEGTRAVEITKTKHGEVGTTPLMLLLDHDWEWPKERVSIETAYPKFTEWVGTPEVDWIISKVEENVIKRQ